MSSLKIVLKFEKIKEAEEAFKGRAQAVEDAENKLKSLKEYMDKSLLAE